MSGPRAAGGISHSQPASRAGLRDPSMPLRITAQAKLDPIQYAHSRFDARDLAVNSFVILFFSLVFVAPLLILGAVVLRLK